MTSAGTISVSLTADTTTFRTAVQKAASTLSQDVPAAAKKAGDAVEDVATKTERAGVRLALAARKARESAKVMGGVSGELATAAALAAAQTGRSTARGASTAMGGVGMAFGGAIRGGAGGGGDGGGRRVPKTQQEIFAELGHVARPVKPLDFIETADRHVAGQLEVIKRSMAAAVAETDRLAAAFDRAATRAQRLQVPPGFAGMVGRARVAVDDLGRALEAAQARASRLDPFKGIAASAGVAGGIVAAALGAGAYSAIKAASTFEETTGVIKQSFGKDGAGVIEEWAKTTGTAFGRSTQQMRGSAASMQAMLAPLVGNREAAARMSTELTKLSVDLASFFNTADDDALIALRAGLVGETEPLRRFGVTILENTLNEYAYAKGIRTRVNQMSEAQKTMLRFQYIMEKTTDAQGNAIREQTNFEGSTKALKAAIEDLRTVVGQDLIEAASSSVQALTGIVRIAADLPAPIRKGAVVVGLLAAGAAASIAVLGGFSFALVSIAQAAMLMLPVLVAVEAVLGVSLVGVLGVATAAVATFTAAYVATTAVLEAFGVAVPKGVSVLGTLVEAVKTATGSMQGFVEVMIDMAFTVLEIARSIASVGSFGLSDLIVDADDIERARSKLQDWNAQLLGSADAAAKGQQSVATAAKVGADVIVDAAKNGRAAEEERQKAIKASRKAYQELAASARSAVQEANVLRAGGAGAIVAVENRFENARRTALAQGRAAGGGGGGDGFDGFDFVFNPVMSEWLGAMRDSFILEMKAAVESLPFQDFERGLDMASRALHLSEKDLNTFRAALKVPENPVFDVVREIGLSDARAASPTPELIDIANEASVRINQLASELQENQMMLSPSLIDGLLRQGARKAVDFVESAETVSEYQRRLEAATQQITGFSDAMAEFRQMNPLSVNRPREDPQNDFLRDVSRENVLSRSAVPEIDAVVFELEDGIRSAAAAAYRAGEALSPAVVSALEKRAAESAAAFALSAESLTEFQRRTQYAAEHVVGFTDALDTSKKTFSFDNVVGDFVRSTLKSIDQGVARSMNSAGITDQITGALLTLFSGGGVDVGALFAAGGQALASSGAFEGIFAALGGTTGMLAGPVGAALGSAVGMLASTVASGLSDAITAITQGTGQALAGAADALTADARIGNAILGIFNPVAIGAALAAAALAGLATMIGSGALVAALALGPLVAPALVLAAAFGVAAVAATALAAGASLVAGVFALLSETAGWARVQAGFAAVMDRVIAALEPLANELIALVGLFDAFVNVLMPFLTVFGDGKDIGEAVFNVFKALAVVAGHLAIAFGNHANFLIGLAQPIATVFATVFSLLGAALQPLMDGIYRLTSVLYQAAAQIPFLPDEIREPLERAADRAAARVGADNGFTRIGNALSDFANELDLARVDTDSMRDALGELIDLTYEEAKARGESIAKEKELLESLTNVPEGVKVALARFRAISTEPSRAPASAVAGAINGGGNVVINNLTVQSNDPRAFLDQMRRMAARSNLQATGTTSREGSILNA